MRSSGPPTGSPELRRRKREVKLSWLNTRPDGRHQRGAVAPDPDLVLCARPEMAWCYKGKRQIDGYLQRSKKKPW